MEKYKSYQTIIVLVLASIIAYIYSGNKVWLYIAICLSVLSIVSERATDIVHFLWMRLGVLLGKISGTLLLSLVFFLVLTPLALIKKLFQSKQKVTNSSSHFLDMNHSYTAKDFIDLW